MDDKLKALLFLIFLEILLKSIWLILLFLAISLFLPEPEDIEHGREHAVENFDYLENDRH